MINVEKKEAAREAPFSSSSCAAWFSKYKDTQEEGDVVGAEGIELLCLKGYRRGRGKCENIASFYFVASK